MDPLLVSGLVAAGSKFIDHIAAARPQAQMPGAANTFESQLTAEQVKPPSELFNFLSSEEISSQRDFKQLKTQLNQQLIHHPELAHFVDKVGDKTAAFSLNLEQGNYFTLSQGESSTHLRLIQNWAKSRCASMK